jgi:hypothetical protein
MALTKVHNRMVEGSPVNVKDYGATGDGSTNDSAAMQAAINASEYVYVPSGTYKISDISVTSNLYLELAPNAVLKSIAEEQADTGTPSDIWYLTSKMFTSTTSGIEFEVDGGTLDGSGARPDALPVSNGPTGTTPDFGEYLIDFDGAEKITFNNVTIKDYLSDGSAGAPNGNRCIQLDDCNFISFNNCSFQEIGNEVMYIDDSRSTKETNVKIVNTNVDQSRGSINVKDAETVLITGCRLSGFSGSPINSFADNVIVTDNNIDDVTNSHGIDFSEGLYRTGQVICKNNVIRNVNNNGINCASIDSIFEGNVIEVAGDFGIKLNSSIGSDVDVNVVISNNVLVDCTDGGIEVKGSGSGTPNNYVGTTITSNIIENKDNTLTSADGIRIFDQAGVTITGNVIDGMLGSHIYGKDRIDNILITGNVLKQSHGSTNQTNHVMFFDGTTDASTLNNIVIQNNLFNAMPPPNKFSVFFDNYTQAYGRFPEFTNVVIKDNTGPLLFKADDGGHVQYSATKSSEAGGSTIEGQFNGGDTVFSYATATGVPSGWRILFDSATVNGLFTYRTAPTATASFTSGSNTVTMSGTSHTIQAGDGIRITDGGGSGVNFDTEVVERDADNPEIIYVRTNLTATGSAKAVAFLGTAKSNNASMGTL